MKLARRRSKYVKFGAGVNAVRAMAAATATRRLAAILAADVVGYSRLMETDEEGTHERVKAHLIELIDPKIREHHGRIVKTTGDDILIEFASVVDAVRCAIAVHDGLALRNAGAAPHISSRWPCQNLVPKRGSRNVCCRAAVGG
jgi:class 3 adenylate cyclase